MLVVEDDDAVREVTVHRVESLGYDVVAARNGAEALDRLRSGARVRVLLTDVGLPGGTSGYDLARWVEANRPGIRTIVSSGYQVEDWSDGGAATRQILAKPYSRERLAAALRAALDGSDDDQAVRTSAAKT